MSLDSLRERLDKTKQLAGWIAAATEKAAEFPSDVVHKVIADYSAQYEGELPGLLELAETASSDRQTLADKAEELEAHKAEVEAKIDEFKLRHVIGELTESEFGEREEEARESIDEAALSDSRSQIARIDELLNEVGEVQNQVSDLLGRSEPAAEAPVQDDPVALDFAADDSAADEAGVDDAAADASPAGDELGEAAYAAGGGDDAAGEEWDVEPAPASPGSLGPDSSSVEESGVESLDVMPGADSQVSGAGEDIEPVAEPEEEAAPQQEPPPPVHGTEQFGSPAPASAVPGEGPRLSVTMPGAGAAEIFPFSGDVMSLGRGRNNDIQIKNDGKISRYHCRIFRRGDEFIVEDNKSSNGTLVDGKLVTRQPLTGGELVQIGETRVEFILR